MYNPESDFFIMRREGRRFYFILFFTLYFFEWYSAAVLLAAWGVSLLASDDIVDELHEDDVTKEFEHLWTLRGFDETEDWVLLDWEFERIMDTQIQDVEMPTMYEMQLPFLASIKINADIKQNWWKKVQDSDIDILNENNDIDLLMKKRVLNAQLILTEQFNRAYDTMLYTGDIWRQQQEAKLNTPENEHKYLFRKKLWKKTHKSRVLNWSFRYVGRVKQRVALARYKSIALITNTFLFETFVATGIYSPNLHEFDIFTFDAHRGIIYWEFMFLQNMHINNQLTLFTDYNINSLDIVDDLIEIRSPLDENFDLDMYIRGITEIPEHQKNIDWEAIEREFEED